MIEGPCLGMAAAPQFQDQAFLATCHGPAVVRAENWFHQPAQPPKQRLSGVDMPTVGDNSFGPVLAKGPSAGSCQVTRGAEGKTFPPSGCPNPGNGSWSPPALSPIAALLLDCTHKPLPSSRRTTWTISGPAMKRPLLPRN